VTIKDTSTFNQSSLFQAKSSYTGGIHTIELLSIADSVVFNCTETVALTNLNISNLIIFNSSLAYSKMISIDSSGIVLSETSDSELGEVEIMNTSISSSYIVFTNEITSISVNHLRID